MPTARILIVRTSAIGDVVFSTPFAAALRRSHPQAHIAWVVEPGIHELLVGNPHIDELILWPKGEWKQLWRQRRLGELHTRVRAFSRMLKAKGFDTAIDLQGLLKSGWLAWLTGAPRRIGLGSREGSQWLMTEVLPRGGDIARISSEYRYLAEHLELDVGDFLPELYPGDPAEAQVQALLTKNGLLPGRYAVLAPFTTRPQKHWFESAWQTLAQRVRDELGLTPVIMGGPMERMAAERIASGVAGVVNLAGETRLPEAAALIRQSGLLIGVDTGLTHMGAAFDTPTVAIFGSTCPYRGTGKANFRVLWLGLECSPCHRHPSCHGAFPCLREITPELVFDAASDILGSR